MGFSALASRAEAWARGLPRWAKVAACFAPMCIIGFFVVYSWINDTATDMWFFLSTGRYICENGIPYTNPFAVQDGLRIVVQQWLWDVADYKLYEALGLTGPALLSVAMCAAVVASAWAAWAEICRVRMRDVPAVPAAWGLGCALFFALPWSVARPHLFTMCALFWVVCVCERYKARGDWKTLCWLPLIMAAHMQVHMSMAWLDVAVACAEMLPEAGHGAPTREGLARFVRSRLPMLAAVAATVSVMPLNPYGVDGMMYLFNSAGAAAYKGAISEMKGLLTTGEPLSWMFAAGIVLTCLLPIFVLIFRWRHGKGKLPLGYALFGLAGALALLMRQRNGWICFLTGACLWACVTWKGGNEDMGNRASEETEEDAGERKTAGGGLPAAAGAPPQDAGEASDPCMDEADEEGKGSLGKRPEPKGNGHDGAAAAADEDSPAIGVGKAGKASGARERGKMPTFGTLLAPLALACAVLLATGLIGDAPSQSKYWNVSGDYLQPALDVIERAEGDKEATVFCTRWVDFNYLEWDGWRVLVDARPEIWEPKISGYPEHLNNEYFDVACAGNTEFDENLVRDYVKEHGCTWMIVCLENQEANPEAVSRYQGLDWAEKVYGNQLYEVYRLNP